MTLKTAWESAETVYIKEGGIWESGFGGGEYKEDLHCWQQRYTPAVSYTQYNWFVLILPLFLPYNLPSDDGAVKQENDQKLNMWREKKQNGTAAASVPE